MDLARAEAAEAKGQARDADDEARSLVKVADFHRQEAFAAFQRAHADAVLAQFAKRLELALSRLVSTGEKSSLVTWAWLL